jgi:hypothetical protein
MRRQDAEPPEVATFIQSALSGPRANVHVVVLPASARATAEVTAPPMSSTVPFPQICRTPPPVRAGVHHVEGRSREGFPSTVAHGVHAVPFHARDHRAPSVPRAVTRSPHLPTPSAQSAGLVRIADRRRPDQCPGHARRGAGADLLSGCDG